MDFGILPPEVNSARMYAGPGSGPMIDAAAGWDRLAVELRSATYAYWSEISAVNAQWLGPSSAAMADAAAPYIVWLSSTADQAEQTAGQMRDAATAYEAAFAAVVPPPLIAANRAQLAGLVATNIAGQNAVPIAAVEAAYAEMWAQDAAAMYAYAAQSAAAAAVTPFAPAPSTTDPGGVASQSTAVAQAAGVSAGNTAHSAMSQLMSTVHSALDGLAAPAATTPSTSVSSIIAPGSTLSTLLEAYEFGGPILLPARNALIAATAGMSLTARGFQTGAIPVAASSLNAGLSSATQVSTSAGAGEATLSAGLGRGSLVGGLSVPPSWATATPTVRLAAAALQGSGVPGVPVAVAAADGTVFGQMALASVVGAALGNNGVRGATGATRPAGDADDGAGVESGGTQDKLKRVLADLSQKPESVQHWHTDKAHLESLLEQLSKKPGTHAVHLSTRDKPGATRPRWG